MRTDCDLLVLPRQAFKQLVLPHPEEHRIVDRLARKRTGRTAGLLRRTGEAPRGYLL